LLHNIARREELRGIKRVQIAPQPRYSNARPVLGDWREERRTQIAEWTDKAEWWVQQWSRIEGWRFKFCTVPRDCCWLRMGIEMGGCECGKWMREGVEQGMWSDELEKRTREVAGRVFRFPIWAEGVETVWGTLAELEGFELVVEDGGRQWVRRGGDEAYGYRKTWARSGDHRRRRGWCSDACGLD